jgi:alkanesulfonate monooxygenase SsuD/methylene tetrahydromethanopterin reductase-like flavin-dependent oxidoreductase (luciferase family)
MAEAVEFIASVVPPGGASPEAAAARRDPDYPIQAASLADEAGFDWLLVGYDPSAPDGILVASEILTTTSRLGVVVTHVPGLVAPTVAARQYATLAAFHPGRVAMHVAIEGGAPDGDDLDQAALPRRAAEFLEVVKLAWSSALAFTYSGEFYQTAGAGSAVGPRDGRLPVYAGADRFGIAHADVCLFSCVSPREFADRASQLRAAGSRQGRSPRCGVSLRLTAAGSPDPGQAGELSWIPPAGCQHALTGSRDQITRDLLDYVAAGATTLVIGHDPHDGTAAELIARVRERTGRQGTGRQGTGRQGTGRQGISAAATRPGRG